MSKKIVFAHHTVADAAVEYAKVTGANIGKIEWKKFDDGWPNIFIKDVEEIRGKDVVFMASLENLDTVFEQLAAIQALTRHFINSLDVKILSLPVEVEYADGESGVISYRNVIFRLLAETPNTRSGKTHFNYMGKSLVLQNMVLLRVRGQFLLDQGVFFPLDKREPLIFHAPSRRDLAIEIADKCGAKIGKITVDEGCEDLNAILLSNEPYNQDVIYLASFDSPRACIEQLAVICYLARRNIRSLKVVLPFFPVGTMERVSVYGEVATAKTMSRILSSIPMIQNLIPAEIITFDIHALQEQFYFEDCVMPDLVSAIPLFKEHIKNIPNVAIAFPDDGACKRFGKMFPEYPHIVCNKVRMSDGKKIVTIKEGDPAGKYVVIVDDLIQTGGTLIECRNVLHKAKASKVSAVATHGVFVNGALAKFTPELFDFVGITDSCPQMVEVAKSYSNVEVFSLQPLIVSRVIC